VKGANPPVYLWTVSALPAAAAQSAGQEIAAAAAFFDSTFGPRAQKKKPPIWVVEGPAPGITRAADSEAPRSHSLPNLVLLSPDSIAQNIAIGQFTDPELTLLAESWTRWIAFPRPDERFLGLSLAAYAVDAWHESREGASARRARISALLRAYDASHPPDSQPSTAAAPKKPPPQETMSPEKASLFLDALEDKCSASHFRQGLAYSLGSLRGREYGYDDLRAGLYSQGCSALGPLFREWLDHPGIPEEFRSRYSQANPAAGSAAAKMEP